MSYQTPKTDWANGDIPTAEDFNRIEGNTQTGTNALVEIWSGSATAGTSIQTTVADDGVVDITKIEGATTVTPANPDLDISPDNVATIESAKDFDVVACGKNLLPKVETRTVNGVTVIQNNDGSLSLSGTATSRSFFAYEIPKLQPGIYSLSANNPLVSDGVKMKLELAGVDANVGSSLFYLANTSSKRENINALQGIDRFTISVEGNTVLSNFIIRPQLELGSTVTPYEPYKSNKITIPHELRSLPNGVKDTIEYIGNGKGKLTQRVGRTTRTTTGSIVDAKTNGQYICSVAPSGFLNGTTFTMPSGATSAEVLYELAEPIETIIDLPPLTSYKGVTNVYTTANPQPKLTVVFKKGVIHNMAYQTPKTDWANGDIPTAEDFNRIEGNTQTGTNALVEIWSGSATAGTTITLSESIYNFRMVFVRMQGVGHVAVVPIYPGMTLFRGGGQHTTGTVAYTNPVGGTVVSATQLKIDAASLVNLNTAHVSAQTLSQLWGMR